VDTGVPLEDTYRQIDAVVVNILQWPPLAYRRRGYLRIVDAMKYRLLKGNRMNAPKTLVRLSVRVINLIVVTLAVEYDKRHAVK
jgi:hypothetical protein